MKFNKKDVTKRFTKSFTAKTTRNSRNYVDNQKLLNDLLEWKRKKISNPSEPIPDYTARAIKNIAYNLGKKYNFKGYTYLEDMIGDAILTCCKYIGNFDPEAKTKSGKPNPFAYITMIISQSFVQRINTEHKQAYIKTKSFEIRGGFDSIPESDIDPNIIKNTLETSGIGSDFMLKNAEYEKKMIKKAEERKIRAAKRKAKSVKSTNVVELLKSQGETE